MEGSKALKLLQTAANNAAEKITKMNGRKGETERVKQIIVTTFVESAAALKNSNE